MCVVSKYTTRDSKSHDVALVGGFDTSSSLSEGEVYSGTVETASRNAVIQLQTGHVNLGPIDTSVVGETVKFEYVGGVWGKCLEDEYIYDGYKPRDGQSSSSNSSRSKPSSGSSWSKSSSGSVGTSGQGTITKSEPRNKNELLRGKL